MGKGRKYSLDRLLSTSASASAGHHSSSPADLPDLDEADVWSASEPDDQHPITSHHTGGLSLAFDPTPSMSQARQQPRGRRHAAGPASSAPVNVPDWTGLVRAGQGDQPAAGRRGCYVEVKSESKEDEGEWVPPHVWAQSGGGTTSSVFEGVGRTLKGRDMSRVRDAVWNQTGFFG